VDQSIEYASLREEIFRRLEARQQILSVLLTLAGAFLGLGWNAGAVVIWIYPLIAICLAVGWAQNETAMSQARAYIREKLENNSGFESYRTTNRARSVIDTFPLNMLSPGSIFLITQLMAMVLGLFRFTRTTPELFLLALNVGVILLTIIILNNVQRQD
jgi:hypothetical protein